MCSSTAPPPPHPNGASRGTYTTLPPSLTAPVAYSPLPPSVPFSDQQIPGVTPHSITIHNRNLKYLEKHKEDEEKRARKYREKSNKEKARSGIINNIYFIGVIIVIFFFYLFCSLIT